MSSSRTHAQSRQHALTDDRRRCTMLYHRSRGHRGYTVISMALLFLGCAIDVPRASEEEAEHISWRTDYGACPGRGQNAKSIAVDPVHRAVVPELHKNGARFLRASHDPGACPAVVRAGEATVRRQRGTGPELRAFRAARHGHRAPRAKLSRSARGILVPASWATCCKPQRGGSTRHRNSPRKRVRRRRILGIRVPNSPLPSPRRKPRSRCRVSARSASFPTSG